MFCPKCKSLMMPKKVGPKTMLVCRCGHKEEQAKKEEPKKDTAAEDDDEGFNIGVVETEFEVYPITKAECPKCHNLEAYFWEVQTRSADEPATKFMKCTKCKHTWRDYK